MCSFSISVFRDLFGSNTTGINFDKYEDIPVEATGDDVPPHVNNVSGIKDVKSLYGGDLFQLATLSYL